MDLVDLVRRLIVPTADGHQQRSSLLCEDVTLRVWRWDGSIATRGRGRVLDWLCEEWQSWPDASLEVFSPSEAQASAVQFRIQATEDGAYTEHNRALFLTYKDGSVNSIDMYCGEPVFTARRKDYIAPPTLTDEEVKVFLEESAHGWDVREWVPQKWWRHASRRVARSGSGDAHPGSNWVGGARWTVDEADERIEEIITEHRRKGIGFQWWVMPFDTPADLGQRLEQHGAMLAGYDVRMARLGLEDLSDIPVNDSLKIEDLDGSRDGAIEEVLQILAVCFHLTPEQIENERPSFYERIRDAEKRAQEVTSLACLDGEPVGFAAATFRFGRTYLNGAATLPAHRGQKVYSTLLKYRLAMAHDRGFHLAAIDAGPMSKRVVEKYGFREFGRVYVYGWMPEMDPEVIRSLVPDE